MTSRDIVFKALKGENTPRPACGPLAVHADCIIRYHEKYQPDVVWISSDTWVTAEAMGAPVQFPGNNQPMSGLQEGFVHSTEDLIKIPKPDPGIQGRQPLMLEALSHVVEALGKDVFIATCTDQECLYLAYAMFVLTSKVEDKYEKGFERAKKAIEINPGSKIYKETLEKIEGEKQENE